MRPFEPRTYDLMHQAVDSSTLPRARGPPPPRRVAAMRPVEPRTSDLMPQAVDSSKLTRVRGPLPLLGPAFVASVAYVDPGNFATNITAGPPSGYRRVGVGR